MRKPKLLYFVSEDWYFCSHRLDLALEAKAAGYDVVVVTRVRDSGQHIREAGLRVLPFEMSRSGLNPVAEMRVLARLVAVYRRERPDIVHHVAMKPVLYGTMAARLCGVGGIVNALAGMGWLFSSGTMLARSVKCVVQLLFRSMLSTTCVIVQNPDDEQLLSRLGCRSVHLIRGSGVDIERNRHIPESPGPCTVLLAARMLWDKGVGEYVGAAEILRGRGVDVRMLLAGEPDDHNPASIPLARLRTWHESGVVAWLGQRNDIPELMRQVHIACLPSYREGLPKFLLEGLAAGRPIVATNVPGCREAVQDGVNGLLVPARDASSLAAALERLIVDKALRESMGKESRKMAERAFSSSLIHSETLALYERLKP